jgi:hypothetical protein
VSYDISISEVTEWDDWGSVPKRGKGFLIIMFSLVIVVPSHISSMFSALPLGINQLEHEANNSAVPSTKVKNAWSLTSVFPVILVWCLGTTLASAVHCTEEGEYEGSDSQVYKHTSYGSRVALREMEIDM